MRGVPTVPTKSASGTAYNNTIRLRTEASFGPKSWRQAATKPEEQRKDDRSQCAQNGLYHGDPFAARWQNYRIARTISTMKSKCETLVMALSELIWWGFVP